MPVNNFRKQPPPGKVYRHYHTPSSYEEGNVKFSISEDGKVTVQQTHEGDEYDEVILSAAMIFQMANMLTRTKKTRLINKEDIPK